MFRKYALIISCTAAALFVPVTAKAQTTMDAAMMIQVYMDEFSRLRGMFEQIKSTQNIMDTKLNVSDMGGMWKEASSAAGGIFDKKKQAEEMDKMPLVLPDALAKSVDDPNASSVIARDILLTKDGEDIKSNLQDKKDRDIFEFTSLMVGYGKAAAIRKKGDKAWQEMPALADAAKNSNSEMEIMSKITELNLLDVQQDQYAQIIKASDAQSDAVASVRAMARDKHLQNQM